MEVPISKNRTPSRSLFSSMMACSFFGHLGLFYLMTIAYSESVERVESPQIKSIKGYLISKEDFLPKEVKKLPNRTTLPAPEYVPEPPAPDPVATSVKLPKEIKKETASKALVTKPKPEEKKDKEKELKKKALEEIKKKLSQPKALPIIAPAVPNRPTPRPENFPLPEGWKESKKTTVEIPLPEGSASGQDGAEAENEKSRALSRYSEIVKNKIINNFSVSYKKALKENPAGKIVVEIEIDLKGSLKSSQIVKSSGFVVLDDNCTNAIQRSAPFPEIPELLRDESTISFILEFPFSELAKFITKE